MTQRGAGVTRPVVTPGTGIPHGWAAVSTQGTLPVPGPPSGCVRTTAIDGAGSLGPTSGTGGAVVHAVSTIAVATAIRNSRGCGVRRSTPTGRRSAPHGFPVRGPRSAAALAQFPQGATFLQFSTTSLTVCVPVAP